MFGIRWKQLFSGCLSSRSQCLNRQTWKACKALFSHVCCFTITSNTDVLHLCFGFLIRAPALAAFLVLWLGYSRLCFGMTYSCSILKFERWNRHNFWWQDVICEINWFCLFVWNDRISHCGFSFITLLEHVVHPAFSLCLLSFEAFPTATLLECFCSYKFINICRYLSHIFSSQGSTLYPPWRKRIFS